jgi:Tyrosine phosphatase family
MNNIAAALGERELQLFLGPRPGKKSLGTLVALDLTHCCTLLSEREDVQPVRKICQSLGCEWVWLPIEGGRLDVLRETDVVGHFQTLIQRIADEPKPRIYFHCSAGIHRTGFFAYLLLRLRGLSRDEAFSELTALRPVTAGQVGEERLDLADELVARFTSDSPTADPASNAADDGSKLSKT